MVRIEFIMNVVKGPLVVGLGNPVAVARSNRVLDVDVSELIATLSLVEDTRVRTLCALLCPKIILASEDWVNCAESARKAALEGRDFLLVGLFRLHSGFLQLGLWPMVQFCRKFSDISSSCLHRASCGIMAFGLLAWSV